MTDQQHLELPALLVGDVEATFVDLALAGLVSGSWQRFSRRSIEGALAVAEGRSDPTGATALGRGLRYQRGLLAADDLRAWLADRNLTAVDWSAHLARWALTQEGEDARQIDEAGEAPEAQPSAVGPSVPDPSVAAGVWWADACISGFWSETAWQLSSWWAAHRLSREADLGDPGVDLDELLREPTFAWLGVDSASLRERLARLTRWRGAENVLAEQRCTPEALSAWLATARLDWTRLEFTELRTASEHAAREARLCIEVDGSSFEDVAERSGLPSSHVVGRCADIDGTLAAALLGAPLGSLLGPLPMNAGWSLAQLHDSRPPTLDDPQVLSAARRAIVEPVIERELAGRVRELAPL